MTPTIKTLTAVAALTLVAGGALAQDKQTVPLAQTGGAAVTAPDSGTTFVVKPDGSRETLTAGTPATDAATDAAADTAAEPAADAAPAEAANGAEAAADATEAKAEATEEPAADPAATEAASSDEAAADTATDEATPADSTDKAAADEAAAPEATSDATDKATPEATPEAAKDETTADEGTDKTAATDDTATDKTATDEAAPEEATDEAADEAAAGDEATDEAGDEAAPEEEEEAEAAATHEQHIPDVAFSFEGPFGAYDQHQLQRGLQVYTEICAACHGLRYVPLRTLGDETGPGLPEDQVRAYAAELSKVDPETGDDVPREPSDNFPYIPHQDGMGPDLSLMAKARAGFHGPYGSGISQLFNGIGGPEYIHAILTGYTGETKEEAGTTFYGNTAFAGGWIAMPPPLDDETVEFQDGHPNDLDSIAKEISAFLMWTAEPKMMQRKQVGMVAVLFLLLLSLLLYLTNKKLWWPVKHPRKDEA